MLLQSMLFVCFIFKKEVCVIPFMWYESKYLLMNHMTVIGSWNIYGTTVLSNFKSAYLKCYWTKSTAVVPENKF